MCYWPSLIVSSRIAVTSILPRAWICRRRPSGVRRVIRMRMWHPVSRSGTWRAGAAAVPTSARPVSIAVMAPVSVAFSVSFSVPFPVPVSIAFSLSLPLGSAPLSVDQIVPLQAPISILAILVLVFISAGMEEARWWWAYEEWLASRWKRK